MKFNKVIFLSLDGVLTCEATKALPSSFEGIHPVFKTFSKESVYWLNEICKRTQASLVITSLWRKAVTANILMDYFKILGAGDIVVRECLLGGIMIDSPAHEVAEFLASNTISNYVILDSENSYFKHQQSRLVLIDKANGLKKEEANNAYFVLERDALTPFSQICPVCKGLLFLTTDISASRQSLVRCNQCNFSNALTSEIDKLGICYE